MKCLNLALSLYVTVHIELRTVYKVWLDFLTSTGELSFFGTHRSPTVLLLLNRSQGTSTIHLLQIIIQVLERLQNSRCCIIFTDTFISQELTVGSVLNDDRWHTVVIKRRAQTIELGIDSHRPVTGKGRQLSRIFYVTSMNWYTGVILFSHMQ